ncbi:MAG TPA: hypothetical protein EYP90_08055 [Chromatiaceae bacterium]|nr:hypothetical protein [Chromatiaceae bacterium]
MKTTTSRRHFLRFLAATSSALLVSQAAAHHTDSHFEDDAKHHIVYQLNKADPRYISHILFSVGEMLRKYGDDIEIVVAVSAEGIHLLGKHPKRAIPRDLQEKAASLAAYGVSFHACGNTLKAVRWTERDLLDFAKPVPIGVDDIMQLQEKGFTYIAW